MPLERDKPNGFKFRLQDELRTGIWPDLFSHRIPLWEDGQNVQFTQTGVEKVNGNEEIDDTTNSEPIRGLLQNTESGDAVIYVGDLSTLYLVNVSDATIETVGTGYSLAEGSGGTTWDSGATTWDSGATTWDSGVVKANHWSMVNYGSWQLATNGVDNPLIRKGVGDFVSLTQAVTGITVTAGGTGYVVDDALTLTGGDGSGAAAKVLAVDGSGVITSVGMTSGGSGYTTVPTGYTGGTGSGATFTFTVSDMDVTTGEVFIARGPHVLLFNTSYNEKEFIWCDADDLDTWQTAGSNLAGSLTIRELRSPIRAAVPLGPKVAVYGDDQMFLVSYLANDLVFGYEPALDGIGAVSKHSVVTVGRQNYGLSSQGFFVTDGVQFDYIDEPAMRAYYENNANINQIAKTFGYHDEENNQIRWYFPTTSALITEGVSFNYKTGVWSLVSGNRSAGRERVVLESPITGTEAGLVLREGVGANDNGSALTAWIRTKPMDIGDADLVKELDSIRIGYIGTGLQYRIGWSEEENDSATWGDYTEMDNGFPFHNLRTAGRWLHFELYSADLNDTWSVMSVEFIGRTEGTR